MTTIKVSGEEEFKRSIIKEFKSIRKDNKKGLLAAAIFVKGEAVEVTPREFGVLAGSAYHRVFREKARVGYTAKYAPIVHEMPEEFNYTTPDTGPKFLENAILDNLRTIQAIIVKRLRR